MGYSIGQVAKKTGLTTHTLRYYEKEGLLPFIKKSGSGLRVFSETDLDWLALIECLKGLFINALICLSAKNKSWKSKWLSCKSIWKKSIIK